MRKWNVLLDEEVVLRIMNESGVGRGMEVEYGRGWNLFNVEGWSFGAYRDFEGGNRGYWRSDGSDCEECQRLGGVVICSEGGLGLQSC